MRRRLLLDERGCRGMSLVEVLVVTAILSIVMLAVMSLYIPAHQSTVAQTQVSDVQSNLRLALRVLTQDLMVAGFLVPVHPVVFPDAAPDYYNPSTRGTENVSDFIIRTRAVGSGFARVASAADSGGHVAVTVTDSDMVTNFPAGSNVRLFEPITASEIGAGGVYSTVGAPSGSTITIDTTLTAAEVPSETLVLRVRDATQPPLQTIRYRLAGGILERIVNDKVQILARNLDTDPAASFFDYVFTAEDRVIRVDARLTGVTKAVKQDAISGAKSRQVETSVMLRNIY